MRLTVPCVGKEEINAVADVLNSGWLTQGGKVAEFEDAVAEYVGSDYAIAVSSCTAALHLSLLACGIGPGDEVLVPDFTFPATANVVVHCGARPVLVDIDLDTYAMNPDDLEAKITERSKCVILVHPFGLFAPIGEISTIVWENDLLLVEDAACSLGATYLTKMCGTFGNTGCYSFHPRKTITTGEGGMVATEDEQIAEKIRKLRNHGRAGNVFEEVGFNYRMSDVHAAIGLAQMEKIDWIIAERRRLAEQLTECLKDSPLVLPSGKGHTFQSYVVRFMNVTGRTLVARELQKRGIETTIGTYALHLQPAFEGDCPNSAKAYVQTMTLPLYIGMDVERLCEAIHACSW